MALKKCVWNEKELLNLSTYQISLFLGLALVQRVLTVNTFHLIIMGCGWQCYDKV